MYTIGAPGLKTHFCSDYGLALLVTKNIKKRGLPLPVLMESRDNVVSWSSDRKDRESRVFYFKTPNLTILCRSIDFFDFKNKIINLSSDKYEGKFFKLHSKTSIICLNHKQLKSLRYLISS